jgi:hypothetical protein
MSVKNIVSEFSRKTGITDRNVVLSFLNVAAQELYEEADLEGSLMEQSFYVDEFRTLAFPTYVGQIRAMRENVSQIRWELINHGPKYSALNWGENAWRKWIVLGISPIMRTRLNQGPLRIEADKDSFTTIVGSTDTSSRVTEIIAGSGETKTSFNDIFSISKDRVTKADTLIYDTDDNLISRIPNYNLVASFKLVDVSKFPSLSVPFVMDVLFKKALPYLSSDTDEFPAPNHDDVIVNKMMQLFKEEQGDLQGAVAYDQKITRSITRKLFDASRGRRISVRFEPHPHDYFLVKNRYEAYHGPTVI